MTGWVDRHWSGADGLMLHARDYAAAAGPARLPMVCIHGLTRNARDFDALAPRLAEGGRRVLAVDVRGRGESARDPDPANYRLPVYAADVVALLATLGIVRAQFVGTSMGGLITMELAGVAPALIAGAVINDVGPELDTAGLTRIGDYVGRAPAFVDWNAAAAHAYAQNHHALPHYHAADWLAMAHRLFREENGLVVVDYDPAIARAFAGGAAGDDPWGRWEALAATGPVLLLRGDLSDLLSVEVARRMVGPGVTLVEVPEVGHAPMLDEPVALAAILDFFDRQP